MHGFLTLSLNEIKQARLLIPYHNITKTVFYDGNAYGLRERTRKPWWLPRAKTKIYKVPPKPVIPLDDASELKRLYNTYRTSYRTVIQFLANELEKEKQTLADSTSEMSLREESIEFDRCMKENDKWNMEVGKIREDRLKRQDEKREMEVLRHIDDIENIQKRHIQKAEQQIQLWKELSPTFIKRDKLDEVIDKALSEVVDHNYAIDMEGNVYQGREVTEVTHTLQECTPLQ